jgi:hypothetical protein
MKLGIGALVVVAGVTIGTQFVEGDEPRPTQTPTEAACGMLADGDTAVEAYDILLDLDTSTAPSTPPWTLKSKIAVPNQYLVSVDVVG